MLNGTRAREHDDEDGGAEQYKRTNTAQAEELGHYDIYALPSLVPPSPLLASPSTHYQSCSFLIVNRAAGLATGLGILIGLAPSPHPLAPHALAPYTNPGFSLAREPGHDAEKAVLLGWVEQEKLAELDGLIRGVEVPMVSNPPRGGEVMEWLLSVGRRLEYEGVLSNPEILLKDVLDRR
ncbi:hypothetical protein JCM6882_009178 [Rhodosporidiobolus microsporus]